MLALSKGIGLGDRIECVVEGKLVGSVVGNIRGILGTFTEWRDFKRHTFSSIDS